MGPGTGSSSKTSPRSPTGLFLPTASCLDPDVSSSKRPRRRAELTSPPFLLPSPQCPPSIRMPSQPSWSATNVATSTLMASAWLMARNAKVAVVRTIILPCAEETEGPSTPSTTAKPDHPNNQADYPKERTDQGQDITIPTASEAPAAKAPPTGLPSRFPRRQRRSTPYWYHQDSIEVVPASPTNSMETSSNPKEDSLLTNVQQMDKSPLHKIVADHKAWDQEHDHKINPSMQVSMIPLSRYKKKFPHKVTKARTPKQGTFHPTIHS